jgi:hypothetical protein
MHSLGTNTTPAMAAGISDHVWIVYKIAALLDSNLDHYPAATTVDATTPRT